MKQKATPPVMTFIGMFLSAKEVFGQEMPADFLIERIRSYGWKGSISRLAQLAAYVQHPGREAEDVRRRTIDPILQITGRALAAPARGRIEASGRCGEAHDG
jgi:hypothetical protein